MGARGLARQQLGAGAAESLLDLGDARFEPVQLGLRRVARLARRDQTLAHVAGHTGGAAALLEALDGILGAALVLVAQLTQVDRCRMFGGSDLFETRTEIADGSASGFLLAHELLEFCPRAQHTSFS